MRPPDPVFEERRAVLEGLAYRILGSRTEAEDAVQDTWLKWEAADRAAIERPAAWLVSVCTRRFDVPYAEVAASLEIQETACRKLVSRARGHVGRAEVRHVAPPERQEELVRAFTSALADGDVSRLSALLSDDVTLSTDSGGKVPALMAPLHGRTDVLAFVSHVLHRYWRSVSWERTALNGAAGGVFRQDGVPIAAVSFAFDVEGRANGIFVWRNPEKLRGLG